MQRRKFFSIPLLGAAVPTEVVTCNLKRISLTLHPSNLPAIVMLSKLNNLYRDPTDTFTIVITNNAYINVRETVREILDAIDSA